MKVFKDIGLILLCGSALGLVEAIFGGSKREAFDLGVLGALGLLQVLLPVLLGYRTDLPTNILVISSLLLTGTVNSVFYYALGLPLELVAFTTIIGGAFALGGLLTARSARTHSNTDQNTQALKE